MTTKCFFPVLITNTLKTKNEKVKKQIIQSESLLYNVFIPVGCSVKFTQHRHNYLLNYTWLNIIEKCILIRFKLYL